jgi:hypothetical protein
MDKIYRSLDEIPEDVQKSTFRGMMALGALLRRVREKTGVLSLTAELMTADRPVRVRADKDNRVWLQVNKREDLELTEGVDNVVRFEGLFPQ